MRFFERAVGTFAVFTNIMFLLRTPVVRLKYRNWKSSVIILVERFELLFLFPTTRHGGDDQELYFRIEITYSGFVFNIPLYTHV